MVSTASRQGPPIHITARRGPCRARELSESLRELVSIALSQTPRNKSRTRHKRENDALMRFPSVDDDAEHITDRSGSSALTEADAVNRDRRNKFQSPERKNTEHSAVDDEHDVPGPYGNADQCGELVGVVNPDGRREHLAARVPLAGANDTTRDPSREPREHPEDDHNTRSERNQNKFEG